MNEIRILKDEVPVATGQLPENWSDIPLKQRRKLLRLAITLPYPYNVHNIMIKHLGLKEPVLRDIETEQLQVMYEHLQWVLTDSVEEPIFKTFKHRFKTYCFPKAKMWNATGLEYALADEYYMKFVQENDEDSLVKLAATLVRPIDKKKKGLDREEDPRIKLTSRTQVEAASRTFEKMPAEVIHSAMLFFTGCKQWVHKTYGQYIFEESANSKKDPFGWYGVFFSLSESGSFGTVEEVAQQNFHTICQYLMKKKMDEPKQNGFKQ